MSPRCTCQRRVTWAGVRSSRSAIGTIVGSSRTSPWAIGDQASVAMSYDAFGGAHRLVAEVRVHLDLVDRRHLPAVVDDPLQVVGLEVRDADRRRPAVAPLRRELGQRAPRRLEVAVVPGRQRPVDEEQVDLVEPEPPQRLVERPARVVGAVEAVVELGGDVELVARDARSPRSPGRRPPRCGTSARCRGAGSPPRAPARPTCWVWSGLTWNDAEAELRDGRAVVELDVGNRVIPGMTTSGTLGIPAGSQPGGVGVAPLPLERQPPGERRDELVDLVGPPRALGVGPDDGRVLQQRLGDLPQPLDALGAW